MPRHGIIHRRLLKTMLCVVANPKKVLAIATAALLVCGLVAYFFLGISTDQDELFSSKVGFFQDYLSFTKNFPENQASYVMIEAVDPAHPPAVNDWVAAADAIADRLKKDTSNVKAVVSHIPLAELGNQGILFEDPKLVRQHFEQFQKLSIPFRPKNFVNSRLGEVPLIRFFNGVQAGSSDSEKPDPQLAEFASLLARGINDALLKPDQPISLGKQVPDLADLDVSDPSKLGYYYVEDKEKPGNHLLLISVYEQDDYASRNGLADAIENIRKDIAAAAEPFNKQFKVNLTGRPALEADEMATTDRDARMSEIAALTAVFIGLVILLRSLWIAVVAEIALLVGIGWTFGWATLAVHRLNLLSMVFLIALTGIGMDYLIQVLTRYRRESARRTSPRGIWTGVFKYVAAPINTACLGAAGAFFVSIFTNFRGAAELGIVASGGLLLCLLTCYLILPPLLTLFPAKPRPADAERKSGQNVPLRPDPIVADRIVVRSRWRHLWLAPPVVWAVLLILGVPFAQRAKFDPSLLKMQAQSLESVKLIHKLQTWSAAVLVPPTDLELLRKVRDKVDRLSTVASTESILSAYDNAEWIHQQKAAPIASADYEPVQPQHDVAMLRQSLKADVQAFKSGDKAGNKSWVTAAADLETLDHTLEATDAAIAASRLSSWQSVFIQQLRDTLAMFPTSLDVKAIPESLLSHLQGKDKQYVLYIYPRHDLWKQSSLKEFVDQVEQAVGDVPGAPKATGIAINVYHSTSSIEKSFYEATAYALGLIFLLVLIDLKNFSQTILAISVLAMGLPMLVALMGLLHIDWNFANFFGLPILIGAGHEYGVFMVHRYNEAATDSHRRWRNWDVSDRALLLCGYVTSVSFGFFWLLGHHEGLKSLGLVMALGTACIYLATLCVLRPLLLWKLGRREVADDLKRL